jgi:hypothetical protein
MSHQILGPRSLQPALATLLNRLRIDRFRKVAENRQRDYRTARNTAQPRQPCRGGNQDAVRNSHQEVGHALLDDGQYPMPHGAFLKRKCHFVEQHNQPIATHAGPPGQPKHQRQIHTA